MQEAFGIVVFAVVIVSAVVAVLTFTLAGRAYDEIGRSLFHRDRGPEGGGAVRPGERDDEIRQLLEARNERRARRGLDPVDIDAELARLTAPAVDPELRAEVRGLVLARNERRARQGREPLDVEAEVERHLRELGA